MPLHLLSKKSWHLYSADNRARVARDEAAADAAERADEERMQAQDAARRTAMLRGEDPPPLEVAVESGSVNDVGPAVRGRGDHTTAAERKRRRKDRGEDDSDHAIRLARQDLDETGSAAAAAAKRRLMAPRHLTTTTRGAAEQQQQQPPITDERGHIQLFAPPEEEEARVTHERVVAAKKRREEEERVMGMRLEHAAGYGAQRNEGPWYASSGSSTAAARREEGGKDAFGRADPGRGERDAKRIAGADPMAVMARAQSDLKRTERERAEYEARRRDELRRMDEEVAREEKRRRRRRRRREEDGKDRDGQRRRSMDSLESFMLDGKEETPRRSRYHDDDHDYDRNEGRRYRTRRSQSPRR